MSKGTAGLLNSLTLLASGIGGVAFGFIADRVGRKRALMLSILTYSVCSFASGLSTSVLMLAIFRFILGLGMGGEWNTGATLVAETWPTELRAKAISIVQSSWAIGYALAALVTGVVLHYADWRMAFFVGILPALVVLWIRRRVPESEMWRERHQAGEGLAGGNRRRDVTSYVTTRDEREAEAGFVRIFRPPFVKHTFALLLMNFFGMFAWWGLFTWIPPYLSLPVEQGGRGFGVMGTTTLLGVLNLAGMFPGYAWAPQDFYHIYLDGSTSGTALCHGESAVDLDGSRNAPGVFRHGIFLRLRDYRQRDLSHRGTGPRLGLHLQRGAHHELGRALCNWARGTDEGSELGFLFVRRVVSAGVRGSDAIARDQGEAAGVVVSGQSSPAALAITRSFVSLPF